jgi:hypothetical protein
MSARMSAAAASCHCSGAMYDGVPIIAPAAVNSTPPASSPRTFASPKSRIFTVCFRPARARIRFAGLMSRWTIPISWACWSPAAACWA